MEVTSFTKKSRHGKSYLKRIKDKKILAKSIGSDFEFIQRNLTPKELDWIKKKIVNRTF